MKKLSGFAIFVFVGVFLIVAALAALGLYVVSVADDRRGPATLDGEMLPGDSLIYSEQVDPQATRIIQRGACYLVQEWSPGQHHWYLSVSSGHGFGGTDNIPAVQCVAYPSQP